jgi:hypothetical protein
MGIFPSSFICLQGLIYSALDDRVMRGLEVVNCLIYESPNPWFGGFGWGYPTNQSGHIPIVELERGKPRCATQAGIDCELDQG